MGEVYFISEDHPKECSVTMSRTFPAPPPSWEDSIPVAGGIWDFTLTTFPAGEFSNVSVEARWNSPDGVPQSFGVAAWSINSSGVVTPTYGNTPLRKSLASNKYRAHAAHPVSVFFRLAADAFVFGTPLTWAIRCERYLPRPVA